MIYVLAFAVIVLLGILGLVLKVHDRLLREFEHLREDRESWEARARQKAMAVLEEARDKAIEILGEARIEAESKRDSLSRKLDRVGERELDDYKQVLQNISVSIESQVDKEMGEFRKALESGTVEAQKTIGEKMESRYNQMMAEVETEKKRKLAELDKKLVAVIKETANSVIGKTLSPEDHLELIMNSLEEAKKRNVL